MIRARLGGCLAFALLLGAGGCKKSAPVAVPTAVGVETGPGGLPVTHPPIEVPATSRNPRRLSIDQMLASVYAVASDNRSITWRYDNASIQKTLGQPDYIYTTEEDLTPSTLYMKFMDDVSRDVCNKMVVAPAASQVLLKYVTRTDTSASNPAAVQKELRYLYLRYFGRHVDEADTATLAPLQRVFDSVVAGTTDAGSLSGSTPSAEGWRAVCMAAFLSPDFNLY